MAGILQLRQRPRPRPNHRRGPLVAGHGKPSLPTPSSCTTLELRLNSRASSARSFNYPSRRYFKDLAMLEPTCTARAPSAPSVVASRNGLSFSVHAGFQRQPQVGANRLAARSSSARGGPGWKKEPCLHTKKNVGGASHVSRSDDQRPPGGWSARGGGGPRGSALRAAQALPARQPH